MASASTRSCHHCETRRRTHPRHAPTAHTCRVRHVHACPHALPPIVGMRGILPDLVSRCHPGAWLQAQISPRLRSIATRLRLGPDSPLPWHRFAPFLAPMIPMSCTRRSVPRSRQPCGWIHVARSFGPHVRRTTPASRRRDGEEPVNRHFDARRVAPRGLFTWRRGAHGGWLVGGREAAGVCVHQTTTSGSRFRATACRCLMHTCA
jgi:hypothetical protein